MSNLEIIKAKWCWQSFFYLSTKSIREKPLIIKLPTRDFNSIWLPDLRGPGAEYGVVYLHKSISKSDASKMMSVCPPQTTDGGQTVTQTRSCLARRCVSNPCKFWFSWTCSRQLVSVRATAPINSKTVHWQQCSSQWVQEWGDHWRVSQITDQFSVCSF